MYDGDACKLQYEKLDAIIETLQSAAVQTKELSATCSDFEAHTEIMIRLNEALAFSFEVKRNIREYAEIL